MTKKKVDLRTTDWRESIVQVSEALKGLDLNDRAIALLIADSSGIAMGTVLKVLQAARTLDKKYLK